MHSESRARVKRLVQKGVAIPNPHSVFIGDEVSLDRIAGDGVVIYPGCKIFGQKTLIMAGARLGYEGPVTVEDCQIGPNQDKATPSLIGDVPRGVMLNQPPIFLGGQGGLVGPVRVEYGMVIPAGIVCRTDLLNGSNLILAQDPSRQCVEPQKRAHSPQLALRPPARRGTSLRLGECVGPYGPEAAGFTSFSPGIYWHIKRRAINNINYIANLVALRRWYLEVRSLFFRGDSMAEMLYEGVLDKLDMAIRERIERFKALAQKMPESAKRYRAIVKEQANEKLLRQN